MRTASTTTTATAGDNTLSGAQHQEAHVHAAETPPVIAVTPSGLGAAAVVVDAEDTTTSRHTTSTSLVRGDPVVRLSLSGGAVGSSSKDSSPRARERSQSTSASYSSSYVTFYVFFFLLALFQSILLGSAWGPSGPPFTCVPSSAQKMPSSSRLAQSYVASKHGRFRGCHFKFSWHCIASSLLCSVPMRSMLGFW